MIFSMSPGFVANNFGLMLFGTTLRHSFELSLQQILTLFMKLATFFSMWYSTWSGAFFDHFFKICFFLSVEGVRVLIREQKYQEKSRILHNLAFV